MAGPSQRSKRHRSPRDIPGGKRVLSSGSSAARSGVQHARIVQDNEGIIDDDDDDNLMVLSREDFENAIKLVTNNKINNVNTWEVKLIEYFYDMNHLKSDDGVSINFQMASATLDGCTKVISKRVDSVGIDTDALIQILAINNDSKSRKKKLRDDDDDDDNENDPDYQGNKKSRHDRTTRETDRFLTVDRLKFNDRHIQFATIDPVFRKMLADFDEGGAKSLLLNSLRMSDEGRVLFDDATSSFVDDNAPYEKGLNHSIVKHEKGEKFYDPTDQSIFNPKSMEVSPEEETVTVALLDSFKDVVRNPSFDSLDICHEITEIKNSIEDVEYGKQFVTKMNEKIEQERKSSPNYDIPEFSVDYDYDIDNFDLNNNDAESGNNFNLSEMTNLSTRNSSSNPENYELYKGDRFQHDEHSIDEEDMLKKESILMAELDRMPTRRRQHWKIRVINAKPRFMGEKENDVAFGNTKVDQNNADATDTLPSKGNKSKKGNIKPKKNEYVIDFMNDSSDLDTSTLFKKSTRPLRSINPDQINSELTTLPDLKSWSSERLVKSLLKPKRRLRNVFTKRSSNSTSTIYADRDFWAAKYNDKNVMQTEDIDQDAADFLYEVMDKHSEEDRENAADNDNAIEDFDIGSDPVVYDFDAPIHEAHLGSDGSHSKYNSQIPSSEGTEAAWLSKSPWHKESIHYEKRSKKINVRLLKQNLWEVVQDRAEKFKQDEFSSSQHENKGTSLKLSDIVKDTYEKYQGREKSDLSTSFFFICMLHIANEEGLSIEKTNDLSDLIIHA